MANIDNNFEMKFRTRRESIGSSDSFHINHSDDIDTDECLESIFEWFSHKNIVMGSPGKQYEELMERNRLSRRKS